MLVANFISFTYKHGYAYTFLDLRKAFDLVLCRDFYENNKHTISMGFISQRSLNKSGNVWHNEHILNFTL